MNTTAAAIEANVTVATIRNWARAGVVTATKAAGRWIIDTASLARRIAIGARKQARMTEPTEVRIDDTTVIRAHQATSPAYGTTAWYAYLYINGHRIGIPTDGATAGQALAQMERIIRDEQAVNARLAALQNSGVFADLTTRQPSERPVGDCHYCGLDARTCDCR